MEGSGAKDEDGGGKGRTGGRDEATTALRGGRDRAGSTGAVGGGGGPLLDPGRAEDARSGTLKLKEGAEGTRKDWLEWWLSCCCW